MTNEEILNYFKDINHVYNNSTKYDTLKRMLDELTEPCEDCRTCNKWSECECGEKGHKNGTSIGYSIGECKDYEPCDCISRAEALAEIEALKKIHFDRVVVLNKVSDSISALPSIQPKTEKFIKMCDATPEERESIEKYIKSISKPTGVDFWNLEQSPCEDCISRKAAIVKMQELEDEDIEAYGCSIPEGFDGKRAIVALKSLPSIQKGVVRNERDKRKPY